MKCRLERIKAEELANTDIKYPITILPRLGANISSKLRDCISSDGDYPIYREKRAQAAVNCS